jgi:hypothetical protein
MKKIIFCLIIFSGSLFAPSYCCDMPMHSDPVMWDSHSVTEAIANIVDLLNQRNNKVENIWKSLNDNQVENILKGFKKKKRLLTNIQNLSREDDITEANQLHEIELKRELNGLLIDTWSVE